MILLFSLLSLNAQAGIWANRFVTYDILSSIFGPSAHSTLEEKVLKHYQVFGGACSLMEANFARDKNNSSLFYCRNGSAESKAKAYANDLIRRNALILSACQELTHKNKSFYYLLGSTSLLIDPLDKAKAILKSFYPQMQEPQSLAKRTYDTSQKNLKFPFLMEFLPLVQADKNEILRKLTYYFCISEKWQKL